MILEAMVQSISLEGKIRGGASISFLSVEVPFEADRYIPLALVRYAIDGQPQAYGLRLDLDKRTFADHLDTPDRDKILDGVCDAIVEIAAKELRRWEYHRLQKEFGNFTDKMVEVTETDEDPVVSIQARIKEEVMIHKDAAERTETVRDRVRREEAEVTKDAADSTARRTIDADEPKR